MKFTEFIAEQDLTEETEDKISIMMYMIENDSILTESDLENLTEAQELLIIEGVHDWLKKTGLKLHKGNGIIDYVIQFSKGAGKLIMAAFKNDKEEVKRIAGTLKKEQVIDFLLKLDMATIHIVTGTIHRIDAWTGWDLSANLNALAKKAESSLHTFYKAMKSVKDSLLSVLDGDKQKRMMKLADKIENNLPDL